MLTTSPDLCAEFVARINAYFGEMFARHSFALADCLCLHDGRECSALYQSPGARLLVEFSDGAFHVLLGSLDAPFPGGISLDYAGQSGWYALFLLAEFKSGRRVYTEKVVQRIWSGKIDPYRFEADLFSRWASRVLPLFAATQEQPWQTAFRRRYARSEDNP